MIGTRPDFEEPDRNQGPAQTGRDIQRSYKRIDQKKMFTSQLQQTNLFFKIIQQRQVPEASTKIRFFSLLLPSPYNSIVSEMLMGHCWCNNLIDVRLYGHDYVLSNCTEISEIIIQGMAIHSQYHFLYVLDILGRKMSLR